MRQCFIVPFTCLLLLPVFSPSVLAVEIVTGFSPSGTAQKRGVVVRVLADEKANSTQYTAVTFLANQGMPVRLNRHYKYFHHKFAVIDNQSVQTGSFNYSANAHCGNTENVVYLRGSPATAAAYTQEFNRLWAESAPLASLYS